MKIKNQIIVSFLFLFLLAVLGSVVAILGLQSTITESKGILENNFNSVKYSKVMLESLDRMEENFETGRQEFGMSLDLQRNNITESNEQELTDSVFQNYLALKPDSSLVARTKRTRSFLFKIMEANMLAIEKRNTAAAENAGQAKIILVMSGVLYVLISLVFISTIPSRIASPVIKRDMDKTNFIATISHEIKTPIASIQLSTQLLENMKVGQLNPEQKQLIKEIRENTERVLRITGSVLTMAQMESGKIALNIQAARPEKIVRYSTEALQAQAAQKNIKIEIECPGNLPDLNADPEKTAWVLTNLLSNAVRYSPDSSTINVRVRSGENFLEFSVHDQGPGVDPSLQEKIFERFFEIPGNQKRGTGLGLSISKEFIEAQGGRIYIQSRTGEGCTFIFELPVYFLNETSI